MVATVLSELGWIMLAIAIYVAPMAVWPLYRLKTRGRPRLRSLFLAFLVHVALILAWTLVEVSAYLRDGDWLEGLTVYVGVNGVFLVAYLALWLVGRAIHRPG